MTHIDLKIDIKTMLPAKNKTGRQEPILYRKWEKALFVHPRKSYPQSVQLEKKVLP